MTRVFKRHLSFTSPANMALPFVKTFADCADFDKTVVAYLPQLYDLPQQIFQSATSWQQLQALYVSTNPLISGFAISLFLAPIFLIASEVNRNYSQVDRFWSLLPTFYNAHFVLYAHLTGIPARRLDTLLIVSGIWSVRCLLMIPLESWLTISGSLDLQLLAQRRVQHWLRGLSLGTFEKVDRATWVLFTQCHLHLFDSKRECILRQPYPKNVLTSPPTGPALLSQHPNLHPPPRGSRHK